MTTVSSGLWMEVDDSGYPDDVAAASDGGYSPLDAAAICAAFTLVLATIVIGNVLVIIAVFNEISLNSEQNWFVASLAVADLTLGLVVMPFSLAQEVMGYWVFGEPWCQGRMDGSTCQQQYLSPEGGRGGSLLQDKYRMPKLPQVPQVPLKLFLSTPQFFHSI